MPSLAHSNSLRAPKEPGRSLYQRPRLLSKISIADWLGLYADVLDRWSGHDLRVERVRLEMVASDPIPHRIQISIVSPAADRRIYGYGESFHEVVAYEKAIAELLEREAVFVRGKQFGLVTTNGLAAHRYPFLARYAAKLELLERDAFLRHWLTRTPLKKIATSNDKLIESFSRALAVSGHELVLAKTYLGQTPSTIAVAINRVTKGFLIGSSAALSAKTQARKAVGEVVLSLFGRRQSGVSWDRPDFDSHANYWYQEKRMPEWFVGDVAQLHTAQLRARVRFIALCDSPISVVAAKSDELLALWVGETPKTVIEKISDTYSVSVNTEPHPFP